MVTKKPVITKHLMWRLELTTCGEVAALSECQIAGVLTGQRGNSYAIRSPEGGDNDLGLLISEEDPHDLDKNSTSRFMQLRNLPAGSKNIVPFDVKSLIAMPYHGTAVWRVGLTPHQVKTCQALIITNPKEPNFVIVLPIQHLHGIEKTVRPDTSTDYIFTGPRPLWTLHPLPAFPPQLTPFVLPLTSLPKAIDDMRGYATGSMEHWSVNPVLRPGTLFSLSFCRVNRYTGAQFTRVLRPTSYGVSVMEPRFLAHRRAYDEIVSLHRSFDQYSQRFRISFCDIRSMLSDFKLTNRWTGEHSHVEAKKQHYVIRRTGSPTLSHAQAELADADFKRSVFT